MLICFIFSDFPLQGSETAPPKICLTMIVKNESSIIERCLDSMKEFVDCICICDTGSTDNTIQIIDDYLQSNHIQGKVYQQEWKNFGYNRTLSVKTAQEMLKEMNYPLDLTYILLLDADMLLEVEPAFEKKQLVHDTYLLIQKSSCLTYYNTRLIRASMPWKCVGVTHEYWDCDIRTNAGRLTTLHINDLGDGGCKADKFERDIKLLTQGLIDEPDNVRYMFYLAQSYKCIEKFDDAINWYTKRISKGGWNEEVWYSKMMIGECYEYKNEWKEALNWYLDAYEFNPDRAEPIHKIANFYRKEGNNHLAYLFAKHGSKIPFPKNQVLFISHPVYDYQFDEEISISAYYTANKNEGFEATDRLSLKKDVPNYIKRQSELNLLVYAPKLNQPVLSITKDQLDNVNALETLPQSHFQNYDKNKYEFSHLKYDLNPLKFDEGFLVLLHQEIERDGKSHRLHRFAYLDKDNKLNKLSRPFMFGTTEESCCRLALDSTETNCLICSEVKNENYYLSTINKTVIRELLQPLP